MQKTILGDIIKIEKGKKPKNESPTAQEGFLPYVDIKAFEKGIIASYADGVKCLPCEEGDLLIVCDGARSGLLGRAKKGYVGSTLAKISADGLLNEYLAYFIQGKYSELNTKMKGTGTPHLNQVLLKSYELNIPTLAEQEKIVLKIEELFSELDKGIEELEQAKARLKVYRQSVLKNAFEGEKEQVKMLDIVNDIRIGPFGTMLHQSDYIENGIPVINPKHIKQLQINESSSVSISEKKAIELSSYKLQVNDVIMGRRGEMGRVAPITERERGWICGTGSILFRLKPEYDAIFYSKILSSPDVVHFLEENATGTTMKNLNEKIVQNIPVPNVTRDKQDNILNSVESKLSICDNIEQTITDSLKKAESLRQSILKKAFNGELV